MYWQPSLPAPQESSPLMAKQCHYSAWPDVIDVLIPRSPSWPFTGLAPAHPCVAGEPRTGLSTPDGSHQRGKITSLGPAGKSARTPGDFLQKGFPAVHSLACTGAWGLCRARTPHGPLIKFMTFLSTRFPTSPGHRLGRTDTWCISHSSPFCIICELAESALCPVV